MQCVGWRLAALLTQRVVGLPPQSDRCPLPLRESVRGLRVVERVGIWLTTPWHQSCVFLAPPRAAGREPPTWLWAGRTGEPGGRLPPGVCGKPRPVFLSSKSLLTSVLVDTAVSGFSFIHVCVLRAPCHCQQLYGLLTFQRLCFYGHWWWKGRAVWGHDPFAFRLDDG